MKTLDTISEQAELDCGKQLVLMLNLKQVKDQHGKAFNPPRYQTEYGTKTAIGLFRTIAPMILQALN